MSITLAGRAFYTSHNCLHVSSVSCVLAGYECVDVFVCARACMRVHVQVHGLKENVCIQYIFVGIRVYTCQVCSIVNAYIFVFR